jgi:phosphonopyruvate decarboxylase
MRIPQLTAGEHFARRMIEAVEFIEAARRAGFTWYAGVPCSFLTPFINQVIDDPTLQYVAAANEGDAVAAAAGASIGGRLAVAMMQNSGLGNAVSPLTSLTHVFHIPLLLICTHRGAPGVADEPQHALMGTITGELLNTLQIPWEHFPTDDAYADTVALNRWIEQEIRRNPAQYLWVHRRFKTRPPGEPSLY